MCSVFDVAKWFLIKENDMKLMRLMGLCYYAKVWYYALYDKELFLENFEAWDYGPVCPELWWRFEKEKLSYGIQKVSANQLSCDNTTIIESINVFLENVYDTYADLSDTALQALTQQEPPWISARNFQSENQSVSKKISMNDAKKYYSSIYRFTENTTYSTCG